MTALPRTLGIAGLGLMGASLARAVSTISRVPVPRALSVTVS